MVFLSVSECPMKVLRRAVTRSSLEKVAVIINNIILLIEEV